MYAKVRKYFFFLLEIRVTVKKVVFVGEGAVLAKDKFYNLIQKANEEHYTVIKR